MDVCARFPDGTWSKDLKSSQKDSGHVQASATHEAGRPIVASGEPQVHGTVTLLEG
jgi:hypothetical protein